MKLCPQCKKENPSSANYCMFCKTLLSDEMSIDEIDQLHIELGEAKEKIVELRKQKDAFEKNNTELQIENKTLQNENKTLQNENKNNISSDESQEKIIADLQLQIKILTAKLAHASKKGKNTGWIVFLVLLCFILGVTVVSFSENSENHKRVHNDLTKQVNQLQLSRNVLLEENTKLKNEKNTLLTSVTLLKSRVPIKYKVNSTQAYIYNRTCNGSYEHFNCIYEYGTILDIYLTEQERGLSFAGWVLLSDLEFVE